MFNVSDLGIAVFELQQKWKLFQAIWLFFGSGFCVEFVRRWILPPMEELIKELKWTEFQNPSTSTRWRQKMTLWRVSKLEKEGKWAKIWRRDKTVQVCGNLRQPQWAIKQMGNLVMPIKSGGREGKNRKMKQNVILMHETLLTTILSKIRPKSASRLSFVTISTSAIISIVRKPCVVERIIFTLSSSWSSLPARPWYNNDHGCQLSFSLSFEHLGSFGQQSQGFSSHPRLFRALFTLKFLQSLLAPS